jgi:hypothetical protein
MNRAAAAPLVSTSSAPKIAMTISTGNSQNFLRARSPQNSPGKLSCQHCLLNDSGVGPGRLPHKPIALGFRFEATPERIIPELPHREPIGTMQQKKMKPRMIRLTMAWQQKAELRPPAVETNRETCGAT